MAAPNVVETKAAIVDSVRERLSSAQMIFSVPLSGLTVSNVYKLKNDLPESSTLMTVKNTLMRRAIAESGWVVAGEIAKESSIWIFVGDDVKGSVEAYKQFAKPLSHGDIKGGVMEGTLFDSEGVSAIAALPSKIELIATVARLINSVPTKIARSINLVPTKVARSVKLAFADGEGEAKEGEPTADGA